MTLFSQRKFINTMLLIALLILSWSGFLAFHQIQRLINSNQWVVHTYNVLSENNRIMLALNTAESDLYHYLMVGTNKQSISDAIHKINRSLVTAQQHIGHLKELTKDNTVQLQHINQLQPLVEAKIALTNQALVSQPLRTSTTDILTKQAEMKENIANVMDQINKEELNLLKKRNAAFAFNIQQADNMLYLSVGVSELLFLLSFILINYHLNQRNLSERKQLASEAYKTAILETASDSIITINQKNKISSFNPQTIKIFGYSSEELTNISINILIPELTKTMTKESGKATFECQAISKSGDKFPVEIAVSKMDLNNEQMLVMIIRDISERKQTEKMKSP